MQYVPSNINIVFIFNGLENWEKAWVQKHYSGLRSVVLKSRLLHGQVIDLLIDHFQKPFGLIDSDCFVFNSRLYEEMQEISNDTLVNALFLFRNEEINLETPQTYFLYFNPKPIVKIKSNYRVNSNPYKYEKLSRNIKKQISKIGIDATHYPESFKNLFDTLRLILCLGLSEGYKINYLRDYHGFPEPNEEVYHVGAVYCNDNVRRLSLFRGSFFWRLCLDRSNDQELVDYYHDKYGSVTAQDLIIKNPEFAGYTSTKNFVEFVEKIVDGQVQHQYFM